MDKCIVMGVESGSYTTRSGEFVSYTKMHYFNLSDKQNSSSQKGFTLLNKDIYPDFSISDFSQVPGVYNLGFRPFRGRRGKMEPKLVSVEFVSALTINQNKDSFLLLGAKKYNYEPEKGKIMKGIKIFVVDPLSHTDSDEYLGLQVLEGSISKGKLENFSQVPGYYDVVMEQVRGRNGDSIYRPVAATFKDPYTLANSSTSPVSSSSTVPK
ncbi:MAG: hypothetical protein QNJ64_16335 [Crocosphaera sp.]|nr:hypothetical protein [Crocosphaera sp.]